MAVVSAETHPPTWKWQRSSQSSEATPSNARGMMRNVRVVDSHGCGSGRGIVGLGVGE